MKYISNSKFKTSSLYSLNPKKFRIIKLPKIPIEGFTNLKNLYLYSNTLQKIQNLHLTNLEELSSDNNIRKIENLGGCPKLNIKFIFIFIIKFIYYLFLHLIHLDHYFYYFQIHYFLYLYYYFYYHYYYYNYYSYEF